MHETVIANKIIEEAKKHGLVKAITIEVGELGHLPAYELEPTLKALVNWRLTIIEKPAKVQCSCGFIGRPKILERGHDMCLFICPKCEEVPKILEGNEIKLNEVEFE